MLTISLAKTDDLAQIVEIYNQAIPSKTATGDTVLLRTEERKEWFNSHIPTKYPIYIAEIKNQIVGWLSLSPYRAGRAAFNQTAEVSYYIDDKHHRKGIASQLLKYATAQCIELNISTLTAYIMEHNVASIQLMEKFAFKRWALLPNIANFDGKEFNHTIYGKRIL